MTAISWAGVRNVRSLRDCLACCDGSRSMVTALAVTNTGSGTWRTLKATVTDAAFKNGGPKGADIALVNTDSLDDIFHLIEVELAKKKSRRLIAWNLHRKIRMVYDMIFK